MKPGHGDQQPYPDSFKSEGERRIAQFLHSQGIEYTYEDPVYVADNDKERVWYPDYHLPEFATYIEYYGLAGQPDYNTGIQKKTRVYADNGLDVIPVYPWTLRQDLPGYIADSLREITDRRRHTLEQKVQYDPQGSSAAPPHLQHLHGYQSRPGRYG